MALFFYQFTPLYGHNLSEFLPKGEQPLTSEENEYIDKRLFEESEKMTEWPEVNVG